MIPTFFYYVAIQWWQEVRIFCYELLFSTCYEQIFCFAQLLLQIIVNYQSQGRFQNLLVLRIPKLTLEVRVDQNLPDLSKI